MTPNYRFSAFFDTLSICPLSKYLQVNPDRNRDLKYSKEDVLSVSGELGIVNQIELLGRSFAGESVADYHVVENNDIVYTKSPLKANPYGIVKCNKGKPGIVSTLYAVYHCKENTDPRYVDYYFAFDDRLNRYLKPLVRIGAKHDMKIGNDEVLVGKVCFPSLPEQQKIADFLTAYDEQLSLQQQKVEALEKRKKGLLQKVFSQELRFKADDGSEYPEWEEIELAKVFNTRNGYTPSKANPEFWTDGKIPWFRMEDIRNNGRILEDSIQHITPSSVKGAGLFPQNTVFFATSATVGEHAIMLVSGLTNQRFTAIIPRQEYENKLIPLYIFYLGYKIDDYCLRNQIVSTMPTVNMKSFDEYPFQIPCKDEQQKIADFFSAIDEQLDIEKQRLESMQLIKKGLLQQMFCDGVEEAESTLEAAPAHEAKIYSFHPESTAYQAAAPEGEYEK